MQRVPALDAANVRRIDRGGEHLEQHTVPGPSASGDGRVSGTIRKHVLGHTVSTLASFTMA